MSEKIVQLNEEVIKGQIKELVRGSVEETLNELLEKEASLPHLRQGQRAVPAGVCGQRPGAGCAAKRHRHRQNDFGVHGDSGNRATAQGDRSHR